MALNPWRTAAAAALMALVGLAGCADDDDSGSNDSAAFGSVTPLNWTSTSTATPGGGTAGTGDTPLLWTDPNLAPIPGGGVTGGELTYGVYDPALYPGNTHPIYTPQAQSLLEEDTLEGLILGVWSTENRRLLLAGGGGMGGVGVGGGLPPLTGYNAILRGLARAFCKHAAMDPTPTENLSLTYRMTAIQANTTNGTETGIASGIGMSASQALNSWTPGINASIYAGGFMGAGYWSAAGTNYWDVIFTTAIP